MIALFLAVGCVFTVCCPYGAVVYQLSADYQYEIDSGVGYLADPNDGNGGNGWLRIMTFKPNEDKIFVYTYSPYLNRYETDFSSQFVLPYPMSDGLDFTIIVLPDTHNYASSYPEIFSSQTQWITQNKDALNIVFVAHVGDVVDDASSMMQWQNAVASMNMIINVPYGIAPGNHDLGNADLYRLYFGAVPWVTYGDGSRLHSYALFDCGEDKYVMMFIPFNPDVSTISWANSILNTYSTRRAIIVTHDYLSSYGQRSEIGECLFNSLVKPNTNVFLVLSGHLPREWQRVDYR
jgi:hypothetical protein